MKKYRFLSLLLLFPMVLTLFTAPAAALEEPDLFCTNAVLLDANYNEVLYDKGYNGMLKTYYYQFLGPKPPKGNRQAAICRIRR